MKNEPTPRFVVGDHVVVRATGAEARIRSVLVGRYSVRYDLNGIGWYVYAPLHEDDLDFKQGVAS